MVERSAVARVVGGSSPLAHPRTNKIIKIKKDPEIGSGLVILRDFTREAMR